MSVIKKCLTCGEEFKIIPYYAKNGRGKFCSKQCHNISMKKREKVVCLYCGSEFEVWPSILKMGHGKYCSNVCRNKDKEKILRVCGVCGKTFYVIPFEIKRNGGKYCSRECTYKGQVKIIKTKCLVCKKDIEVTPAHKERGNGKFCSKQCGAIWRNRNQKTKDTGIEIIIKKWLTENNIAFTPQYPTKHTLVDFFILPNICLFTDGDYWHGTRFPKRQIKDKIITSNLIEEGYMVIRLWESDIQKGKRPLEILEYANNNSFNKNKKGGQKI